MAAESGKSINKLEELKRKQEHILQMGGLKAIEARHSKGQMSARERIDYFFDPGTFTEIGLFITHRTTAFGMDRREVPAEGVITGFGKVNGRYVVVAAEDFTAMAGTFGEYHGKKFVRAVDFAKDSGWPFVGMNDSGGARLQEGIDTLESYGWLLSSCNARFPNSDKAHRIHGHCWSGFCKNANRGRN